MTDIKNQVQNINPNARARDIRDFINKTGNIYEALAVITSRAKQLSVDIKQELHGKLEEFAITSETIEEIQENKEQIEISKFYEKLPNPTIIATEEYFDGKLEHRQRDRSTNLD
ncbi:MAG: DNA-directed RNA polymerase subunit omega [Saprospiraceae bacterium]|nr:DNA-directed RNA polymerase subunit omega [Bacteroidia bacterium]NNE15935.1 DNA-directed RNA polymerase subunit omega [Saprospiraceae bacterium]NNL93650.1 DNA-directed RNA polymerase subunit omega [Saprospiraceae bacterium]